MSFREEFIKHLRAGSVFHASGATLPLSASSVDTTKGNFGEQGTTSPADSQNPDLEHANSVAEAKSTAPKKAPTNIFRDGFKNFLLGEGPSVSKTLATYLIAPLFVAAYPLSKLTELLSFRINELRENKADKNRTTKLNVAFLLLSPTVVALAGLLFVFKVAREILRLALTPVAEVFNFGFAAIQALRPAPVKLLSDQRLSLETIEVFLRYDKALDEHELNARTKLVKLAKLANEASPILKSTMKSVALPIWTLGVSLLVDYIKSSRKKDGVLPEKQSSNDVFARSDNSHELDRAPPAFQVTTSSDAQQRAQASVPAPVHKNDDRDTSSCGFRC